MLTTHDKWFLLFCIASFCAGFLGLCHRAEGGEIEQLYRFPYEAYGQKSYHPSIPYYQQYKAEIYRNRTYWYGFGDPVPNSGTSRCVNDWNYRIIRQMERNRLRNEAWGSQGKRFRNYFRRRR